jgi:hypothetical protein
VGTQRDQGLFQRWVLKQFLHFVGLGGDFWPFERLATFAYRIISDF